MKKLNIILFLLGAVFLAVLVRNIGAGEIWHELGLLGWGLLPFILGEGVAEMIHTLGWRCCLVEPYRSLSWWRLFQIRMVGYAINYLTPTAALGGEAARINLLAVHHRGPQAVSGVLIEKFCFAFSIVLFVVIGSGFIIANARLPGPVWFSMLSSVLFVAAGIVTFFLLQKYGKLGGILRWLARQWPRNAMLKNAAARFSQVDDALRAFHREQPGNMWRAVGWHLVGFCTGILQTRLFLHLLNLQTSWPVAAGVWFLSMWFDLLTFAVPLNLGTLEGSRIVVFKAFGYASLPGMTFGLALRLAQMFWSVVGLIIYGCLTARENNPAEELQTGLQPHGNKSTQFKNERSDVKTKAALMLFGLALTAIATVTMTGCSTVQPPPRDEASLLQRRAEAAAIPNDWKSPAPGTFAKETMNNLADLGEKMGADPSTWRNEPPPP